MPSDSTIWYRVGYALERARHRESSLDERGDGGKPEGRSRGNGKEPEWPTVDDLVASGVVALAGRVLGAWMPARRVTYAHLLRAGLAGAGATIVLDMIRPLLSGRTELPELDRETGARVLAGASQGLLYGAVFEPRVPGPPLLKGAVFALAEYMAHPAGGLSRVLGAHAPHRQLPGVAHLLDGIEPHEREYLEHLAFGVALAVLCGSAPAGRSSDGEVD